MTMVAYGNANGPAHSPLPEQKLTSSVLQDFHDARTILQLSALEVGAI